MGTPKTILDDRYNLIIENNYVNILEKISLFFFKKCLVCYYNFFVFLMNDDQRWYVNIGCKSDGSPAINELV